MDWSLGGWNRPLFGSGAVLSDGRCLWTVRDVAGGGYIGSLAWVPDEGGQLDIHRLIVEFRSADFMLDGEELGTLRCTVVGMFGDRAGVTVLFTAVQPEA